MYIWVVTARVMPTSEYKIVVGTYSTGERAKTFAEDYVLGTDPDGPNKVDWQPNYISRDNEIAGYSITSGYYKDQCIITRTKLDLHVKRFVKGENK